jgi:hypothetical protein
MLQNEMKAGFRDINLMGTLPYRLLWRWREGQPAALSL